MTIIWILTFQALAFARKKNANPQTPPSRACERRGRCRCRFYQPVRLCLTIFHSSFLFLPSLANKQSATVGGEQRRKQLVISTTAGKEKFSSCSLFPYFSFPLSPSTQTSPHRSIRQMTNDSSWLPISCGRGLATPYHGRHTALFPQPNAINPD